VVGGEVGQVEPKSVPVSAVGHSRKESEVGVTPAGMLPHKPVLLQMTMAERRGRELSSEGRVPVNWL